MKRMKVLLTLFSLLLIASTCRDNNENCHRYITFVNQSSRDVYVRWVYSYPDTLYLIHGPNPATDPLRLKVKASSTSISPFQERDCWEDLFGDLMDTLMVYVFDAEVLETVNWSTVIMENMILRRYDLSLDDLHQKDWTITYP